MVETARTEVASVFNERVICQMVCMALHERVGRRRRDDRRKPYRRARSSGTGVAAGAGHRRDHHHVRFGRLILARHIAKATDAVHQLVQLG